MTCKECRARGDNYYLDEEDEQVSCCDACIENGEIDPECYKCFINDADYYLDGEDNWVNGCSECNNGITEDK